MKKEKKRRLSGARVTKGDVRKSPLKKTVKTEAEIFLFPPHRKRAASPSGCVVRCSWENRQLKFRCGEIEGW